MKEKVKLKDIKVKDKQAQEKGIKLLDMWKAFWSPEVEETSEVETIMNDESLSKEMKELLIKSLRNADRIVKPTDEGVSRKSIRLKVEAREGINEALRENPVQIKQRNVDTQQQEKTIGED